MAIYMPPLCRKKKVLERYNPDSFRVISYVAEDAHLKSDVEDVNKPSEWRRIWLENQGLALPDIYNKKTEVFPQPAPDFRINRPHPGACGFLRHNVRLLNEPICSVYTDITQDKQQQWWPTRVSNETLQIPPRTNNTIYREDFMETERQVGAAFGSTRHTSNPNKEPALGTVPVNFLRASSDKQRFFKENISYEHQYNSRSHPNYPIRGKRHGSFVWDQMSGDGTKKFIDQYSLITSEEGARRQEAMEADRFATEAAKLLEDTNFVQTAPVVQTISTPKQESPKTSNKFSPANSGPSSPKNPASRKNSVSSSPKDPASRKNSGQAMPKKVSSRETSVSSGNKSNENVAERNTAEKPLENKEAPFIGENNNTV